MCIYHVNMILAITKNSAKNEIHNTINIIILY